MITSNITAILIVTGVLTATMLAQFVAPSWTIRHTFGETPSGPVTIALERHWGLLLFCIGTLLIYSAFHPATREAAVILALVEKAGFVGCVLGTSLRQYPIALVMAAADGVMALVYILYLLGVQMCATLAGIELVGRRHGSVTPSVPGGGTYYLCGNTGFSPAYGANAVYYRVVPARQLKRHVANLATNYRLGEVDADRGRRSGGSFEISNSTRVVLDAQHNGSVAAQRTYSAVNLLLL